MPMERDGMERVSRRLRGAQPGNTNAWKHGRRSYKAELSRKLTCARLKLAAHILQVHAKAEGRSFQSHARPMRRDQLELLRREDPEGWSLAVGSVPTSYMTSSRASVD